MKLHTFKFVAALVAGLLLGAGAQAAPSDGEIIVPVSRAELISLPSELAEVIVANPDVADVYVHGATKVSVVGKAVGTTNLRVLDKQNRVLRSLVVRVTYDLPAIRQTLYQLFPYEDIAVQVVNNNLALTGMVSNAAVASKAVMIVNEFLLPGGDRPRGEGFNTANQLVEGGDSGVINMLHVTSGQQVMLRVRVGEMQRNALKQLGFSWSAGGGSITFGTGLDLLEAGGAGIVSAGEGAFGIDPDSFGLLGGSVNIGSNGGLAAAIDALEQNNLFKSLAEPNLVAMSGEEAEFLAGGEFPIPIATQNDSISVEFKQFGVAVRFLPTVLSDSRVRIQVSPEISELSDTGSVTLNGFTIPALTTRRARTTVELAPGESFMIAGLLQDRSDTTIEQLPGLGEVPVLGALFRSTDFQRNETELVIAVTPYLVDPVTGDEVRLPTDNYRPSSMMEQFFYGALGSLSGDAMRVSQTPSLEGPIGFMVD